MSRVGAGCSNFGSGKIVADHQGENRIRRRGNLVAPRACDKTIFDEEELLSNFSGYHELARTVVMQATEALPARFDALERAVLSANWPEAQRLVHTAKSLAGQIGGMRLSKELAKAEDMLRRGGEITDKNVAELRRELALLMEAFRKWST